MGAVWLSLRAELRLRWRALAGLALLLGLIGGVVLTAAAGARRTDTAYPRLLQWADAAQVQVLPLSNGPTPRFFAALARLPQLATMYTACLYQAELPVRRGVPVDQVETFSSPGPGHLMGVAGDRIKMLQGRLFGSRAAGQAVIDQKLADLEHLRPGGVLHLVAIPNNPQTGLPELQHAVRLAFRVSGIGVFDTQVVPATATNALPTALLSPSFANSPGSAQFSYGTFAGVRLRPGAGMATFLQAASVLGNRYHTGGVDDITMSDEVTATELAIGPEAVALGLFTALAGLITLAIIGQLLSRQLTLAAAEYPILRALGMSRGRLVAVSLARMATVTVAGGAIAVAVAVAASPLMPIGPARLAEPDPGIEVNLAVLGAGLAAIALLPLVLLVPAAWRAAGRAGGPLGVAEATTTVRASRLASALARAGSVTGSLGVRMAFEPGHGRTAVPVRSALVGTTVAVAAVAAALVFGTSLVALVSTPHRYGQNWSEDLDLQFGGAPATLATKILSTEPAVTQWAGGNYGPLIIDGKVVAAIGIDPLRGRGFLTILAGRAPSGPGEIALGAQTMRAIGRGLGQTVAVAANGGKPRTMRVVGTAVLPAFSRGSFAATDLGIGAVVPAAVLSVRSSPNNNTGCFTNATCYNFFLLRYKPGTNLGAAAARLSALLIKSGCPIGSCTVSADQRPSDIKNYTGVRDTPLVLGAVLGLLAVGTLAHVLLTGVRRRRRDLAVLKTLGLLGSQMIKVVCWQASALTAVALLVGLPAGVLVGRWAWALFAGSAGVADQADVPVALILLAVPATLLLANLIAAGPSWAAAQIRPALILHSE
jgi:ABC-type antimicrobial peptide transport system permease subunit